MAVSNGAPFTVQKISPRAGIELKSARSVDQRLIHLTTGAHQQQKDSSGIKSKTR